MALDAQKLDNARVYINFHFLQNYTLALSGCENARSHISVVWSLRVCVYVQFVCMCIGLCVYILVCT